ncbi:hypothetical protein PVAP13_6KG257618 [Panicum virgatum]|uniref:Uncharacterized protein n=1 Tax=Panicum virgatum TaxID=38727 RepID=A0A8T0RDP3_PANVG|nr:hypothetical protein PVAP13_6KG257618 [Panicum virgatum]
MQRSRHRPDGVAAPPRDGMVGSTLSETARNDGKAAAPRDGRAAHAQWDGGIRGRGLIRRWDGGGGGGGVRRPPGAGTDCGGGGGGGGGGCVRGMRRAGVRPPPGAGADWGGGGVRGARREGEIGWEEDRSGADCGGGGVREEYSWPNGPSPTGRH